MTDSEYYRRGRKVGVFKKGQLLILGRINSLENDGEGFVAGEDFLRLVIAGKADDRRVAMLTTDAPIVFRRRFERLAPQPRVGMWMPKGKVLERAIGACTILMVEL